jgi:hypothetical protein
MSFTRPYWPEGYAPSTEEWDALFQSLQEAFDAALQMRGTWNNGATYDENDVVIYGGTFYVALRTTTADVPGASPLDWLAWGGSGGGGLSGSSSESATKTVTSGSLAQGAVDSSKAAKLSRVFALSKVATSRAAWVRLYATAADRAADLGRGLNDDPTEGINVALEFRTNAQRLTLLTPNVTVTDSQAVTTGLPATIINLDATGPVAVTFDYFPIQNYAS